MTSEARAILKRSKKPASSWRRLFAAAYGIALMALVFGLVGEELWSELRIPLTFTESLEGVKWARVNESAREDILYDAESGKFIATSEEALRKLVPATPAIAVTWTLTGVLVVGAGVLLGFLAVRFGLTERGVLVGVCSILVLSALVLFGSHELWKTHRTSLTLTTSFEDVEWASVDEAAEGDIYWNAGDKVLLATSKAALQTMAPSKAATTTAWLVAVAVAALLGMAIGRVVLALGYFADGARIATLLFFTIFGLTMVVPFVWMVSMALKSLQETNMTELDWVPWPIRWQNFREVFVTVPFGRFYLNSLFMATYVTLGMIFTSALAAYSFARLDFPLRDKLFLAYLATMMIPGAVVSVPVFVLMCKIGWVDSYRAIIIPGIFSAYGTFMLRQFFMTLPRDLEDAAKIDGCSLFGIFLRIILPLSKPALATLTIFTFMGSWRNFMWPLIILNDPKKMPLPVGLQFFAASEAPDPNVLMAATMLMIVPVIVIFILGQRYFVEGIQLGAVKG